MDQNNVRLGKKLAHDLMALGNERTAAQRIQFMGGKWADGEINQGGMNKDALERFFAGWLAKHLSGEEIER